MRRETIFGSDPKLLQGSFTAQADEGFRGIFQEASPMTVAVLNTGCGADVGQEQAKTNLPTKIACSDYTAASKQSKMLSLSLPLCTWRCSAVIAASLHPILRLISIR